MNVQRLCKALKTGAEYFTAIAAAVGTVIGVVAAFVTVPVGIGVAVAAGIGFIFGCFGIYRSLRHAPHVEGVHHANESDEESSHERRHRSHHHHHKHSHHHQEEHKEADSPVNSVRVMEPHRGGGITIVIENSDRSPRMFTPKVRHEANDAVLVEEYHHRREHK